MTLNRVGAVPRCEEGGVTSCSLMEGSELGVHSPLHKEVAGAYTERVALMEESTAEKSNESWMLW